MAISYVATRATTGTYATATTVTVSPGTSVTVGNFLVLSIKTSSGYTVSTVTDSESNTWAFVGSNTSSAASVFVYYALVTNSYKSGDLITITLNSGTNSLAQIVLSEVSGLNLTSNATYGLNTFTSSGTSSGARNLSATTTSNDFVLSIIGTTGSAGQTFTNTGTGFTNIPATGPSGTIQLGVAYQVQTATGNGTNTWNYTSSATYRMLMVAFTPVGKVTFNANGGTGSGTQTSVFGTNLTSLSTLGISRTGYIFGGWCNTSDGSGTTTYKDGAYYDFTASITLYAIWIYNPTGQSFAFYSSGATTSTSGNNTIVTLTGSNNLYVYGSEKNVSMLIVGGGGGGGGGDYTTLANGGGGGGGQVLSLTGISISSGIYNYNVGITSPYTGLSSGIFGYISAGGASGGGGDGSNGSSGNSGSSGGASGGGGSSGGYAGGGGVGTSGSGGAGTGTTASITSGAGGGGGGAGSNGASATSITVGGAGGNGVISTITGTVVYYGGGGGGAGSIGGAGGLGGGGTGQSVSSGTPNSGINGASNTGGGGGGAGDGYDGGSGGSGTIIFSYFSGSHLLSLLGVGN